MSDEKRFVCSNCGNTFNEADKYCRICGTSRENGKEVFSPRKNYDSTTCVYGPLIRVKYTCSSCNYSWEDVGVGLLTENHNCPECGSNALSYDSEMKHPFHNETISVESASYANSDSQSISSTTITSSACTTTDNYSMRATATNTYTDCNTSFSYTNSSDQTDCNTSTSTTRSIAYNVKDSMTSCTSKNCSSTNNNTTQE